MLPGFESAGYVVQEVLGYTSFLPPLGDSTDTSYWDWEEAILDFLSFCPSVSVTDGVRNGVSRDLQLEKYL